MSATTRPVLKHGPRSLARARVRGRPESPRRNEGGIPGRGEREAPGAPPARLARAVRAAGRWSVSVRARTRKMVNYAWAGRSQRKLWWRSVAVLTCKSVVRPGSRGERLIEPSSSWFPPKFPQDSWHSARGQFYPVKRMIRGLGAETISTYSQTFNG
ncbi:hypothetical protein Q9966_016714 [Columba livia]|nr:hypothetical protein Q9966_016714 [Columba livia]